MSNPARSPWAIAFPHPPLLCAPPLRLCLSPQFPCARVPTQPGSNPKSPYILSPPWMFLCYVGGGRGRKRGEGDAQSGSEEEKLIQLGGRGKVEVEVCICSKISIPEAAGSCPLPFSLGVTTKLRRRSLHLFDRRRGGKTAACILYPIACRFFTLLLRYTLHARSLLLWRRRYSRSAFQAPPPPP